MKASEHPPRVRQRALPLKLSTAVSLMIGSVIGAVLLLVYALWYMQISNATRDGLKETALAVARTMADMPQVKRGLEAPPQQQIIQPLAQAITRRNDLLYAIVTDMQGIRYSHPDSSIIGKPFIGHDIQPTLQGKENVAINHGVLAPALRVFTPVFNERHQQIGVVVVGISLSKVDEQIANSRWDVLLTILFSALVCALGTLEPGSRPEARAAGAGAARNIHPVSAASGHASRPQGGGGSGRCPWRGKSHQPRGGRDPLFRPG